MNPVREANLRAAARLLAAPKLGARAARWIIDAGGIEAVCERPLDDEAEPRLVAVARALKTSCRDEAATVAAWQAQGAVTVFDAEYPARLRKLADPPLLWFMRGADLLSIDAPHVAIVGCRRPTPYGERMAARLAGELAAAGAVIGSGLALGIDAAAHRSAVAAGGRTWAVLPAGVDPVAPLANRGLAADILDAGGALYSQHPAATPVRAYHFPERNRLIAALADVVVVVEGRRDSGALITADYALDIGVEVMAVPGHVGDPEAEAPHMLLARGAAPVLGAHSVLAALGWTGRPGFAADEAVAGAESGLSEDLRRVLSHVPVSGSIHIDELALQVDASPSAIIAELLELELMGWVEQLPGKHFARTTGRGVRL